MKIRKNSVLLCIIFSMLILISINNESFAVENETLKFETEIPFSFNVPTNWIYEENVLLSNSGWVVTLYDSEEWSISSDISQYKSPILLRNLSDDEVIETTFLSYYYLCNENIFEKIPFVELDSQLQNLLFYHHQKEIDEFLTDTQDITEWYYYLSLDELNDFFNPKTPDNQAPKLNQPPELENYLRGDMCSDFLPIEYEISKSDDFSRFEIFYTWKQSFPDGTFFEHFSTSNDLWLDSNSSSYVISINTNSNYEDFEIHVDSVDEIIKSFKIYDLNEKSPQKISQNTRITFGMWANNQIHSADIFYELEYMVNENIIKKPVHISNFDRIQITSVPSWMKNSSQWFYEQQIPDSQFFTLIEYLLDTKIIESKIDRR